MSIGATLKIGMDSTDVSRGLHGISKRLGSFGSGKPAASTGKPTASLIEDTNTILSDIRKNTLTSTWA